MSNISYKAHSRVVLQYCKICKISFTSVMELELHDKNVHPKLKCPSCVKLFETAEQLQTHVDVDHDVQCEFCVKSFGSFKEMESHDRIAHLTIKCPYCDKRYRSDEQLQKHIEYKHKFQCELCNKSFSHIEKLRNHDKYVHLTIECPSCDELFFRRDDDLLKHIKSSHTNFSCTSCPSPKWFTSQEVRDFHIEQMHKVPRRKEESSELLFDFLFS